MTENSIFIERVEVVTEDLLEAFRHLIPQLSREHALPSRGELQLLVDFPGSVLLVAREESDRRIIGSATLSILRTPMGVHARLEDVVVDEQERGRGVGAALTREVIRLARQTGADYIALTSNPRREAANKLYQSMGFKRWETNVYRYDLK